jgi:hypothetical protein
MGEDGMSEPKTGLDLLREPFPPHQISKLPKPYKKDSPKGQCAECGGYHGLPAMHLSYVGHAALTDRLLDCDPLWAWEPVAFGPDGLPATDRLGGLWIRLTVCGHSRLGYGHADGKQGGDAIKEAIGDAMRNAAMRFGAALDLWHKGDLHLDDDDDKPVAETPPAEPQRDPVKIADGIIAAFAKAKTVADLDAGKADGTKVADAWYWLEKNAEAQAQRVNAACQKRYAELQPKPAADLGGDSIPY